MPPKPAGKFGFSARPSHAPPANSQKAQQQLESDQALIAILNQQGEKITLKELQHPRNAPRIVRNVIPSLISNASTMPIAPDTMEDLIRQFCEYPILHQKCVGTTALAAIVQYFLSIFERESPRNWFNVRDINHPETPRIRVVLQLLSRIIGTISMHDQTLLAHFVEMKMDGDRLSNLWDEEIRLEHMTAEQKHTEERDADACAQAEEQIRALQEDTSLDTKYAETINLKEKVLKKLEEVNSGLARTEEQLERLRKATVECEHQLLSDADEVLARVDRAKQERERTKAEVARKYEEFMNRRQRNAHFENAVHGVSAVATRIGNLRNKDGTHLTLLEAEKTQQSYRLALTTDEFNIKQHSVDRLKNGVESRRRKIQQRKNELSSEKNRQSRLQEGRRRECAGLRDQLKKTHNECDQLRTFVSQSNGEGETLRQQCGQLLIENQLMIERRQKEVDDVVLNVETKHATVNARFAERSREFAEEHGVDPDKIAGKGAMPLEVQQVYENTQKMRRAVRSGGSTPAVPKFADLMAAEDQSAAVAPAS